MLKKIPSYMIDGTDMREREASIGLTVAREFESKYDQVKAERQEIADKLKQVSKYEGEVPVH